MLFFYSIYSYLVPLSASGTKPKLRDSSLFSDKRT